MSDTPTDTPAKARRDQRNGYGNGTFYVNAAKRRVELRFYVEGNPVRQCVRASLRDRTEAAAKADCKRQMAEARAEAKAAAGYDPTTMAALVTDWLASVRQLSAAKAERYSVNAQRIIDANGAVSTIDYAATPGLARQLLADRAAAGARPATVAGLRFVLGAACQYGVDHRRMPRNPVRLLGKTPRAEGVRAKAHRWYDLGQHAVALAYLADADNHDDRTALVAVMLLAGLRSEEARALTWADVDRSRGLLTVCKAVTAAGRIGPAKTAAGHRVVPMAPELRAILLRQAQGQLAAGTYAADGLVFPSAEGGLLTSAMVTTAAEAFARQTGLVVEGRYLHPHGFRHTAAVVWLEGGLTMHQVAKLLGHADATMVAKVYGHAGRDNAAIDLGAVMGNAAAKATAEAEGVAL